MPAPKGAFMGKAARVATNHPGERAYERYGIALTYGDLDELRRRIRERETVLLGYIPSNRPDGQRRERHLATWRGEHIVLVIVRYPEVWILTVMPRRLELPKLNWRDTKKHRARPKYEAWDRREALADE